MTKEQEYKTLAENNRKFAVDETLSETNRFDSRIRAIVFDVAAALAHDYAVRCAALRAEIFRNMPNALDPTHSQIVQSIIDDQSRFSKDEESTLPSPPAILIFDDPIDPTETLYEAARKEAKEWERLKGYPL